MTSIGPNTQSYNFTHMYDIPDLRGKYPMSIECPNTLTTMIHQNPDFKKFSYILKKSGLENIYRDSQANFTLFVPSDKVLPEHVIMNMDKCTAINIVKASCLDRKITSELLENSPACYFLTKNPPNRLFITNMNGRTFINNNINIIQKDILANNGIIHVIDKLIIPEMS